MPARQPPSLLARAITLLSRREHSEKELREKLRPHAQSPEELDQVIEKLQQGRWQSDARYVESFVYQKQAGWGSRRILQSLKQQAITAEALEETAEKLRETEFDRCLQVWRNKFKNQRYTDPKHYAQQMRFLVYRGFNPDTVRRIVDGAPWEED